MTNTTDSTNDLLIVDDDELLRELLPLLLGPHVKKVTTADSAESAIAMLRLLAAESRPAVILTDLQMPGIAAGELAERLREVCPVSTRIIAMSGSKPPPGVRSAFDGFLLKPFTAANFAEVLCSTRAIPRPQPPAPVEPMDRAIFSKLLAVMGQTQLTQLYKLLLDDTSARQLRMAESAQLLDADTLVREAHAMKGSCGMLGATELHTLAARVEAGGLECTLLLNDFAPAIDRLQRMLDLQTGGAITVPESAVLSQKNA